MTSILSGLLDNRGLASDGDKFREKKSTVPVFYLATLLVNRFQPGWRPMKQRAKATRAIDKLNSGAAYDLDQNVYHSFCGSDRIRIHHTGATFRGIWEINTLNSIFSFMK